MEVMRDNVISLTYELRLDGKEGQVIETVDQKNPLVFLYGSGNLLPKFEENISGLSVGENFDFELKNRDAYGEPTDEAIVGVPISAFEVEGKVDEKLLQTGNMVPMVDQNGRRLNGKVVEIGDEVVTMDFNHPLAGNDLYFSGTITDIREATDSELEHGHVHDK